MCNLQTENKFWKDTFNAFQGIQERLEIKDGINDMYVNPYGGTNLKVTGKLFFINPRIKRA